MQMFSILYKTEFASHSKFGQEYRHDSWMSKYVKTCRGQSHVVTDSRRLQARSQIELSETEIFFFRDLECFGKALCRCQGQEVSAGDQVHCS